MPERRLMKTFIAIALTFFQLAVAAAAEDSFTANGSTVVFARPDPTQWYLVHNGVDEKSGKYLLMFQHKPIKDAEGRDVEPVMALVSESVTDSSDIVTYSIHKRTQVPLEVKKLITYKDGGFTYQNAVGYEAEYTRKGIRRSSYLRLDGARV